MSGVSAQQVETNSPPVVRPSERAIPPAMTGPVVSLSLPEAVALGLQQSRDVRSAYLGRISERFDLRVARDRFNPQVLVTGSVARTDNREAGTNTNSADAQQSVTLLTPIGTLLGLTVSQSQTDRSRSGTSGDAGVTLSIVQPLLRNAGVDVATAPLRQARITENQNVLSLKSTVIGFVSSVVSSYHGLIEAEQNIAIQRASVERSRDLVEQNRLLIEAGRLARQEQIQADANLARQELSLAQTENSYNSARLDFLQLLALDLRSRVEASERLVADELTMDADEAIRIAFENRPDWLSQLLNEESARISLVVAKNERLWDVTLSATVDRTTTGDNTGEAIEDLQSGPWNSTVRLGVGIPITDLRRRAGEVSADVSLRQQRLTTENLRENIENEVRDALFNLEVLWRQLELARRNVELSRRQLETESLKLSFGRTSNFQIVSFENDLRSAQISELSALISYRNAVVALDSALGTTLDTWAIAFNP